MAFTMELSSLVLSAIFSIFVSILTSMETTVEDSQYKLDHIDEQIIHDLQINGRMTNIELAKRAGISAPPCLKRVQSLQKKNIIRGYHANINPEALGYRVTEFVFISLSSSSEKELRFFEEYIQNFDLVRECYLISGDYDFLLVIVAPDTRDSEAFIEKYIKILDNVSEIVTSLLIRRTKWLAGVPLVDRSKGKKP